MKFLIAVLALVLPATGRSAGMPEDPRIIASVTEIVERRAPATPGICVRMLVHSPSELRGTGFELFDPARSRRTVRAEFQVGTLFSLQLPVSAISGLRRYKVVIEENERKLDSGVPPEKITESPVLPRVELTKLARPPSPISVF